MEFSILNLLLVLSVAWVSGLLASRLGYPSVLGELLAGILLGPPLLGLLHGSEALTVLAEVGILVMMLYIGMEIDPKELGKASKGGVLAALGGFATPFVLCYLAVVWAGGSPMAAVFVGVAAGVTSLATKSRILVDLHLLDTRIAHVMMAGALIADTLSLIIFAAIIGVAEAGVLSGQEIVLTLMRAIGFFALAWLVGAKLLPLVARRLDRLGTTASFTFVLLVGLLFAEGAELVGLHGVLGAFLAGLFLREQVFGRSLSERLVDLVRHASIGFLAPIFFVTSGFAVSLDVFATDLGLLLTVVGLATVGKIVGTALFYLPTGHGWREGLVLGAGMNGRGAVEIIVAQIGLSLGLISQDIFSILVFMAIATTATVPIFLKWGSAWLQRRGELARSEEERDGVLIVGAGPAAQTLGRVLARSQPVHMVDRNAEQCAQALLDGLEAVQGDALDERVLARAQASHVRSFIALTPNPEVNALAARLAREVFLVPDVHVLNGREETGREKESLEDAAMAHHLGSTTLFGGPARLSEWDYHLEHDEAVTMGMPITHAITPEALYRRLRDTVPALPIAVRRGGHYLPFHSGSTLQENDRVILLQVNEEQDLPLDRFDRLVRRAPILDLSGPLEADTFFDMASAALAPELNMASAELAARFADREAASSTVILPGLAVPHTVLEGSDRFAILVARCRNGVVFPDQPERVHALFVLAGTADERNFHLRAVAAIAKIVQWPDFEQRWLEAPDAEALRQLVLRSPRRRQPESPTADVS